MSPDDVRHAVLRALGTVAPEVDLSTVAGSDDVREALDIDSMDFLRFVVRLHDELHVDIPEGDYGRVRTVDDCVTYLASRLPR